MTTEEFIKSMKRSDAESETAKALSDEDRKLIFDYILECARGSQEEKDRWSKYWFNECLKNDIATSDMLYIAKKHDQRDIAPTTVTDIIIHADD